MLLTVASALVGGLAIVDFIDGITRSWQPLPLLEGTALGLAVGSLVMTPAWIGGPGRAKLALWLLIVFWTSALIATATILPQRLPVNAAEFRSVGMLLAIGFGFLVRYVVRRRYRVSQVVAAK